MQEHENQTPQASRHAINTHAIPTAGGIPLGEKAAEERARRRSSVSGAAARASVDRSTATGDASTTPKTAYDDKTERNTSINAGVERGSDGAVGSADAGAGVAERSSSVGGSSSSAPRASIGSISESEGSKERRGSSGSHGKLGKLKDKLHIGKK